MTYSIYFEVIDGSDGLPEIASAQIAGNAPRGHYSITGHLHNPETNDAGEMLTLQVPNGGSVSASFPQTASRPPTLTTPPDHPAAKARVAGWADMGPDKLGTDADAQAFNA